MSFRSSCLASLAYPARLAFEIDSRASDLYNGAMTIARYRVRRASEGIGAHLVGYVNLFSGL